MREHEYCTCVVPILYYTCLSLQGFKFFSLVAIIDLNDNADNTDLTSLVSKNEENM